ncbi:MAG: S9 family peptidase [Candidatus Jidaibacter sp.]|jgi:dipeptidyl aminopeptidase/acylaminoacyl peptidase|nr:S9 family peptidase [Candidatus Jidaibacter sp.]
MKNIVKTIIMVFCLLILPSCNSNYSLSTLLSRSSRTTAFKCFAKKNDSFYGYSNRRKLPRPLTEIEKNIAKVIVALFCISILTACNEKGETVSKKDFIPRKVLFGNPDKTAVRLSPDGKYISFIAPHEGVLNIFVGDAKDPSAAKAVTFDKGRGIRSYFWGYREGELFYMQDTDGDENTIVYTLNLRTLEPKALTREGVKSYVSSLTENLPDQILINSNKRDPRFFDVYRYNLDSGDMKMIFENTEYVGFTTDDDNQIRFATKMLANGDEQIDKFIDGKPEVFKTIKFEDSTTSGVIGLNKAGSKLFMLDSSGRDKGALFEIELASNATKLIAENDKADIQNIITDPKTDEIQAYTYNYERSITVVLDQSIKDDFDYLNKLDSGEMQVVSRTLKDDFWIVAYLKDNAPISYYHYDRAAKKANFLFVHNEKLAEYKLSKMNPVVIKSRDGLNLVSYLTIPGGEEKLKDPVPLILYVHGGPNARDVWGYDSAHQWLADRGYAVLSVNYRGSTGFGKKFVRAGDGEWSRKMHDDLLDATNWAIDQGITTKDKVGIFGGSYGGYATLVGLTMTPDVFACGVDIVGPSNLETLYNSIPPYWEPFKIDLVRKLGGDPATEEGKKELAARSPLTYYEKISKPLLIAQGANDPRVKQAESDQIANKMVEKSIPVTYLLYPNEGHGFARPENRASFYAIAEQFLAKCFGKNAEPVGSDMDNSSVQIVHGDKVN